MKEKVSHIYLEKVKMKLIVGLGNPGKEYEITRHNLGFMSLDYYAKTYQLNFKFDKSFNAAIIQSVINNEQVIFLKPYTFMNLSGESVSKVVNYFKIDINDILVIQDDMSLNFGKIRLKTNSSSGGQNGIKNIIECLGTKAFLRLKLGILNDDKKDANSFVMGKFNQTELQNIPNILEEVNHCINDFIDGKSLDSLMNQYNK